MFSFTFIFLTLALWPVVTHQASFSSPNYMAAYGPGAYESNVVWYVGKTKEVVYDISDMNGLSNYTIALWQQSLYEQSANLGSAIESKWLFDVYVSYFGALGDLRECGSTTTFRGR